MLSNGMGRCYPQKEGIVVIDHRPPSHNVAKLSLPSMALFLVLIECCQALCLCGCNLASENSQLF